MLQVILFVLLFSTGMLQLSSEKTAAVKNFFDGAYEILLRMIGSIMRVTPLGVFALMAALITEAPSAEIFLALGIYLISVLLGLAVILYVVYPLIVKSIGGVSPLTFLKGMAPAQLVAFSTSSAAATIPVTMDCIQNRLHISKEISNFVVPVGASVNMDGTTLYQAIAAIFLAQVMGHHLTFNDQLTLVFTTALAGFGAAAVPGGGILMLVIVLESIGIRPAGIGLILAIDRPLDMCRTVVNVTGDGMVAIVMQKLTGSKN